jgi:F-type H+-transporting ATPase subunit b
MRITKNIRYAVMAFPVVLAALPSWAAADNDKGGLPQLDTSLFVEQLFWLAISFALLYLLMSAVALPRVAKTQDNRKNIIAAEIEAARAAHEAAKATIAAVEKSMTEARAKAQATVSEMVAEVTANATERQSAQERDLLRHLHSAEADIAVTRQAAMKKIHESAADLATTVVEKILGFKSRGAA